MPVTRISSKGQVVLPQSIRESRKWHPGTELIVEETKDGVLLRPVKLFPPTTLEEVAKIVQYNGEPKTIEQMEEAIAKGVKERRARGRY